MSLTTADIAKAGRTTVRGVHIWEGKGLLGPVSRDRFGARTFTPKHLARARLVASAQMAGMSLAEIKAASEAEITFKVASAIAFMRSVTDDGQDFDL